MVITSNSGYGSGVGLEPSLFHHLIFLDQELFFLQCTLPPLPPPQRQSHTVGLKIFVKCLHTGGQCCDGLAFHPWRGGRVVGGVVIITSWCFQPR